MAIFWKYRKFKWRDQKRKIQINELIKTAFIKACQRKVRPYYHTNGMLILIISQTKTHPGVNFINNLCAAFAQADRDSIKKTVNLIVYIELVGSGRMKAAHRSLMKLTPGVNFILILLNTFVQKYFCSFSLITVWLCDFLAKECWSKSCS